MYRPVILLSSALALSVAGPALAQDNATARAKPVKEKKICRNGAPTGSRLSSSTCHTAAEWAEIDQANADAAGNLRTDRSSSGNR